MIDVTVPFKGEEGILVGLAVVMHTHVFTRWVATAYLPNFVPALWIKK